MLPSNVYANSFFCYLSGLKKKHIILSIRNLLKMSRNDDYKPRLLAWNELNLNEIDSIIAVFKSRNINDIY